VGGKNSLRNLAETTADIIIELIRQRTTLLSNGVKEAFAAIRGKKPSGGVTYVTRQKR